MENRRNHQTGLCHEAEGDAAVSPENLNGGGGRKEGGKEDVKK
jgi:hypothetical protein